MSTDGMIVVENVDEADELRRAFEEAALQQAQAFPTREGPFLVIEDIVWETKPEKSLKNLWYIVKDRVLDVLLVLWYGLDEIMYGDSFT